MMLTFNSFQGFLLVFLDSDMAVLFLVQLIHMAPEQNVIGTSGESNSEAVMGAESFFRQRLVGCAVGVVLILQMCFGSLLKV